MRPPSSIAVARGDDQAEAFASRRNQGEGADLADLSVSRATIGGVDWNSLWQLLQARFAASLVASDVEASLLLPVALAAAIVVVVVPQLWRIVRTVVTVVHEMGHAVVGVLCGRQFTGFVINGDMSGHTLTRGKPRGFGRILTTFAGYPVPAAVGAAIAVAALAGWVDVVLLVTFLLLLVVLFRSRSWFTVGLLLLLLVATAGLWLWGQAAVSTAVVLGLGAVLVVGGWRHLGAVIMRGDASQDPGVLADLTYLPAFFWNLLFVVCNGAVTYWLGTLLVPVLASTVLH